MNLLIVRLRHRSPRKPPHLNTFPATVRYPAGWKAPKAHRIEFTRKLQRVVPRDLPHPNYLAGYLPGSRLRKANRVEFVRRLQPTPKPEAYVTRAGPSPAVVTGGGFVTSYRSPRRAQSPLIGGLVGFWEVAGAADAEPGALGAPRSKRVEFTRRLKRYPALPSAPQTPPTVAQPPSAHALKRARYVAQTRRLQKAPHPPAHPLKASAALWPSFKQPKAIRVEQVRKLNRFVHPPSHPLKASATSASGPYVPFLKREQRSRRVKRPPYPAFYPSAVPSAAVPAQILIQRSRWIEQKRRHLKPPVHSVYPIPTPSVASVASVTLVRVQRTRPGKKREVEFVGVIVDTLSAAVYPAFLRKDSFRRTNHRRLRNYPELSLWTPRPATPEQAPSAFRLRTVHRIAQERVRRAHAPLGYYLHRPADAPAFAPFRGYHRRDIERRALRVPRHDEWTVTPPRPFTYAALVQYRVFRTQQVRRHLHAPNIDYGPTASAPIQIGAALRAVFDRSPKYLSAEITSRVGVEGEITSRSVLLAGFSIRPAYLDADMSAAVYLEGDL